MLVTLAALSGCGQRARDSSSAPAAIETTPASTGGFSSQGVRDIPPELDGIKLFAGNTGQIYDWEQLFLAMENADVIIIGESHTDARGHAIQAELIAAALQRWGGLTLSLEEFDRSQQAALDAFQRGELAAEDIQAMGVFVMPTVRNNWMDWYFPKLEAAREAGATLLASNAPLKYSRLVRNIGCDNLPELQTAERALFECPAAAEDPAYKARFVASLRSAVGRSRPQGLKPLEAEFAALAGVGRQGGDVALHGVEIDHQGRAVDGGRADAEPDQPLAATSCQRIAAPICLLACCLAASAGRPLAARR